MINFNDIEQSKNWKSIKKINLGWSKDEKYLVIDNEDNKFVLRVADIDYFETKKIEYKIMQEMYKTVKTMSEPIQFGVCNDYKNCYILVSYIEGEQAEIVVPSLPEEEQYNLGYKAGKYLRKLHNSLPEIKDFNWEEHYNKKIDSRIENHKKLDIKNDVVDKIIPFINENRHLLKDRKVVWQHGDYHVGNLIVDEDKNLSIIDFNRIKKADPYYEFNRILISSQFTDSFACGQIDGYFDDDIPKDFFKLMKFYIASVLIGTIAWAVPFGEKDIKFATDSLNHLYEVYNKLDSDVPSWY